MDTNIDGGVRQSPFALYRGSDFFESFIPSIWFLLGVVVVEMLFFGVGTIHNGLQELVQLRNAVAVTTEEQGPKPRSQFGTAPHNTIAAPPAAPRTDTAAGPPAADKSSGDSAQVSLSLEIFFVLLLAIIVISLVFILGQIMNGLSAAILDRVVVKKLLHYPFYLYQEWQKDRSLASHRVVRLAVLKASYLVHCVNLIPLLLLEAYIVCIDIPQIEAGRLGLPWVAFIVVLTILHLGAPAIWSHRKYDCLKNGAGAAMVAVHAVVLAVAAWLLVGRIERSRSFAWIFVLFGVNVVLVVLDRFWGGAAIKAETKPGPFFYYLRVSFPNLIYSASQLVNYSDLAKPQITAEAEELLGKSAVHDLFWASYLTVQNVAPRSFLPITHFLAMYGMMRNLCNATMLVWLYSVIALATRTTEASNAVAFWWVGALAVAGYLCFTRYLYLYGSYFSKYVVRAAAVLQRLNSLGLLRSEAKP